MPQAPLSICSMPHSCRRGFRPRRRHGLTTSVGCGSLTVQVAHPLSSCWLFFCRFPRICSCLVRIRIGSRTSARSCGAGCGGRVPWNGMHQPHRIGSISRRRLLLLSSAFSSFLLSKEDSIHRSRGPSCMCHALRPLAGIPVNASQSQPGGGRVNRETGDFMPVLLILPSSNGGIRSKTNSKEISIGPSRRRLLVAN